jgi:choline dehydrogenase-like flavoprotein
MICFETSSGQSRYWRFPPVEEAIGSQPRRFASPHHFMGTNPDAYDPRSGVIDSDCRIHDVPNLFIAGSSVFPTGGFANPTLTIVALALRLATHLQSELQSSAWIKTNPTSTQTTNSSVQAAVG